MPLPSSHPRFDVYTLLRADEARWAAKVEDEVEFPERTRFGGRGFICRLGNLALCVRSVEGGTEYVPVFVGPDLLGGFSRMTLENAQRAAAAHPAGFVVEHVTATATNRLREMRDLIATLENLASVGADNENNATA
jgi:hypothetical protein